MDRAMNGDARQSLVPAWPCSLVVFLFFGLASPTPTSGLLAADARPGIYNPVHEYDTRPVHDRFTRFLADWDGGRTSDIDLSGDLPFLESLLKQLEVPVTSQMLV